MGAAGNSPRAMARRYSSPLISAAAPAPAAGSSQATVRVLPSLSPTYVPLLSGSHARDLRCSLR
jgi:hypothetical protein